MEISCCQRHYRLHRRLACIILKFIIQAYFCETSIDQLISAVKKCKLIDNLKIESCVQPHRNGHNCKRFGTCEMWLRWRLLKLNWILVRWCLTAEEKKTDVDKSIKICKRDWLHFIRTMIPFKWHVASVQDAKEDDPRLHDGQDERATVKEIAWRKTEQHGNFVI